MYLFRAQGREGAKGEGGKDSPGDTLLSMEPDRKLSLMTLKSRLSQVRGLIDYATQAPQSQPSFKFSL